MTALIDKIVNHGLGTRFTDLSADAITAIETFLLDTIGVGVAGASAPLTKIIRASAERWSGGGAAHIWGPGQHATTPAIAAFINGFQIHCQEFDCVHEPAVVHPLATILAALMAEVESQEKSVSGPELACALAVSVDLAAGLGVAVRSPIKFFRPATAGLFGATLGVSRLRGLTPEQTKDALGYALAFCSGTMQAHVEGKPALPVQIANAARSAIMACDLSEGGLSGPHDVFDGPFGYLTLFEDEADLAPVVETFGKIWRIAEVSHKPFPTGRAAQGGIVLMQKLRGAGVTPDAVGSIELSAPPLIERLVGRPLTENMTANYARLCFQYSGALALMNDAVGLADFSDATLCDPSVHALGQRIHVRNNGDTDPAAFTPQIAVATLENGETVEARIDALYGSPADPMSHAAHLEKFCACMAFGFGTPETERCDRLIELTNNIETLEDARLLAKLAAGYEG